MCYKFSGSRFEQDFKMGILIRGANGDAQSLEESTTNPNLSPDMHNRTRKLKCTGVSYHSSRFCQNRVKC